MEEARSLSDVERGLEKLLPGLPAARQELMLTRALAAAELAGRYEALRTAR